MKKIVTTFFLCASIATAQNHTEQTLQRLAQLFTERGEPSVHYTQALLRVIAIAHAIAPQQGCMMANAMRHIDALHQVADRIFIVNLWQDAAHRELVEDYMRGLETRAQLTGIVQLRLLRDLWQRIGDQNAVARVNQMIRDEIQERRNNFKS